MLADKVQSKLQKANITLDIADHDRKILAQNPQAIFVANQLLPGMDEWILWSVLSEHCADLKLLHPYPTPLDKSLKEHSIRNQRNPLMRVRFAKKVTRSIKKGAGIALIVDFSDNPLLGLGRNLVRPQIMRQLRKSSQPIIPIHLIPDRPIESTLLYRTFASLLFSIALPPLRVSVRVGNPIIPKEAAHFPSNRLWSKYLQAKIFALGSTFEVKADQFGNQKVEQQAPLAEAVATQLLLDDIAKLPESAKLGARGQFDLFVAPFSALPNIMPEIARLREMTFRAVGEGTGKERDMDEYDLYYLQLIIWDRDAQCIVGGYRLGQGDQIFRQFGVEGFYTSSLFKMSPGIYPTLQKAVELGRSYVIPSYQKHRLPLFLLWKGILLFLIAHPQYRFLYGPVSISKYYSEVSKGVIVAFVSRYFFNAELAKFVKPRKAFRIRNRSVNVGLLADQFEGQFDALEHFVEDIEPWHLPVPVLFRQYLRQNARFIAFNVDPLFSDCLDGLMLLDIQQLPEGTLEMLQQEK